MRVGVDRAVHVEPVMGTVVSFDVRDGTGAIAAAVEEACAWLHEVDRTYSPFRPDSVINRLDRGELLPSGAGEEVEAVLGACAELHRDTGGAFDVRASGRLDPSGYVKGWATERAARMLDAHGLRDFQINAGGDILVRGDAEQPGAGWRIGIRHPHRADALAAVVELHDAAMATSAAYERGRHVIDPRTGAAAAGLDSVSVVATDLGHADAWATARLAAGPRGLDQLRGVGELEYLTICGESLSHTAGFPLSDPSRAPGAGTRAARPVATPTQRELGWRNPASAARRIGCT